MRNLSEVGSILTSDAIRTMGANVNVSPGMLEAAQRGRVGEVVRLARRQAGMNQTQLADAIGYSQAAVSRIERGAGATAHDVRTLRMLARVLEIPGTLLGIAAEPGEEEPVDRRGFLRVAAAGATAAAAGHLIGFGQVGRSDVEAIEAAIIDLRALDQRAGGDRLHQLAAQQYQHAQQLLRNGSYGPDIERRLHAALADAAILAGWLSFDAGRHDTAHGFYADAITATFTGNNPLTQAYALSLMSMQAHNVGQPREAVRLAQAGQRIAKNHGGGNRLKSLLQVREARGLAGLGERASAEQALAVADRVLTAPARGSDPTWVEFFAAAELAGAAGMAYAALGDHRRGAEHVQEAVHIVGRTRNQLSWEMCLANIQAAGGDPAAGSATALQALPRLTEVSSARVRKQLGKVVTTVAPHGNIREVRELTGRITALGLIA